MRKFGSISFPQKIPQKKELWVVWIGSDQCCAVLPFWENLRSGSDVLKNLCDGSLGSGWARLFPNLNVSVLVLSQFFFSNSWTFGPQFLVEPGPIPCTHYTFPQCERLCEYKVLWQIKIRVYVNIELSN
jgi:hypothetical protein